jgi:phospholipid/cholesterol/gamma-HCH transport system substrate-binding protein
MRQNVRNFMVGLVSIGSIIGVSALLMMFGELDRWLKDRYPIIVELNNAGGIRDGSLVTLNGVPVGMVDRLRLSDNPDYPVQIVAIVSEGVVLPATVSPRVEASLIGGGATLQLVGHPNPSLPALPTDGTAVIRGIHRTLAEQISHELDARTKPLLSALESFNDLSATWSRFGENLNDFVKPIAPGEEDDPANLRLAATRFNAILERADEALALANEWLGDDQLRRDAAEAVKKASALMENASAAVDRYAALADDLKGDADVFMKRLVPVMDEMGRALEQVRAVTTLASEGDGTVGLLLNNPELYRSLADAAQRLERTLALVEQLVEKIRAEGLTVEF